MEIFYRKNTKQEKEKKYKNNKGIRSHDIFMLMSLCEPTENISQGFLFFSSCFNTKP